MRLSEAMADVLKALILFLTFPFLLLLVYWWIVYAGTIMERRVYEQSYQRVEALRDKASTLEAAIAEVESKLETASDSEEIRELEARLRTLRVQLNAAKARLEEVR